jgi:uncharacterized protein
MIIDAFNHIWPPKYFQALLDGPPVARQLAERLGTLTTLVDLDARFRVMDEFEDYTQVLTLSSPAIEAIYEPARVPEVMRLANDATAELLHRYPDRFIAGTVTLALTHVEESVREIERGVKDLGLHGVQLFTNVLGRPLDDPEFFPVFAKAAELDLPIWIHPTRAPERADYPTRDRSYFDLYYLFGWPYETSAMMTHLSCAGLFDRLPDLKIITHHLGGVTPYLADRIQGTYDTFGGRTSEDLAQLRGLQRHPAEYFRLFYGDTALYGGTPGLECGLAFFGEDQVVFASDMPYGMEQGRHYIVETLKAVDAMTASRQAKQKIYEGNVKRLLKLR